MINVYLLIVSYEKVPYRAERPFRESFLDGPFFQRTSILSISGQIFRMSNCG